MKGTHNAKETTVTTTPKYVVKFGSVVVLGSGPVAHTPSAWNCKRDGRPTDENLRSYVRGLEDSTLPGGVNEHLGVTRVGRASIVLNGTSDEVASYAPSMFEVA